MNFARPSRDLRICRYSPSDSQRAAIPGSFCGSPAFIGKSVRGRKTVERQSFLESSVLVVSGASAIWLAALAGEDGDATDSILPELGSGRTSRQSLQLPRHRLVLAHVRDQRLDSVELLLLAEIAVERDLDLAAVKVAVEVEEVRFQKLLRRLERRADAEAGDARKLASVVQRHAHCVDPVLWPQIVAEHQVRGRVAEFPPALVATLHHALDRIIAAQHMGRRAGIALHQRFTDTPG